MKTKIFKIATVIAGTLFFAGVHTASAQWGTNGLNIYNANTGNVGVGTNVPAYKLQVVGDIYANGGLFRVSGNNGLLFQDWGGGFYMSDNYWIRTYGGKGIWSNGGVIGTNGGFSSGYGGNAPPAGGAIIAGNVGIGTTDPSLGGKVSSRFSVSQTDGSTGFAVGNGSNPRFALNGNSNGSWSAYDYAAGSWSQGITQQSGNVGIGTGSPSYKLHAIGDIFADGGWLRASGNNGLYFQSWGGGFYMSDNYWIRTYGNNGIYNNDGVIGTNGGLSSGYSGDGPPAGGAIIAGYVGIGTANPGSPLQVYTPNGGTISNFSTTSTANSAVYIGNGTAGMNLGIGSATIGGYAYSFSGNYFIGGDGAPTLFVQGMSGGNVGINTTSPGYPLDVNGIIRANEVKVCAFGTCDFVFDKNYKLMTVDSLGAYVKQNQHLPGIASAAQMESEGSVSLGKMDSQLLQKVEELTLYIVELEKNNKEMYKNNKEMYKRIEDLENKVNK